MSSFDRAQTEHEGRRPDDEPIGGWEEEDMTHEESSDVDTEGGLIRVHHDEGFGGSVKIDLLDEDVEELQAEPGDLGPVTARVEVPMDLVMELAGRRLQALWTDVLEGTTGRQFLELVGPVGPDEL